MAVLCELGKAIVTHNKDRLIANTGEIERVWKWAGGGFVTVSLKNIDSGKEWAGTPKYRCDWSLPGLIDDSTEANLLNLTANPGTDEGFTSQHIEVIAEIEYPESGILVQFVIWIYPDSPGIRTQIRIKGLDGFSAGNSEEYSRSDYIPVKFGSTIRREIGYYNDTQHRNEPAMDILKEEIIASSVYSIEEHTWGSIICVENDMDGMALVKESHKCVNQPGHDCGIFRCDAEKGIESTGLGVRPDEILDERFRNCWGNWCIVYQATDDDREMAFKTFDRIRYPIDPKRDIYIISNTWGSTENKQDAQEAASEANVLLEIDSKADLGIDVQQIDDGWQGSEYKNWRPVQSRYPDGWTNVVSHAKEKGISLGLWAAGQPISLEDLKYNYDHGGFGHYKLDFISLRNHGQIESLIGKVRDFIKYTGHKVRVNWDVTENAPRCGYFYAREYGCIYLENRKPVQPKNVVYKPHTVLRDVWQVAKYLNLNKFQCSVQNIDRVNPEESDAHLHNHPYCVAITLMGVPIFFQQTHYYTPEARDQIRPLLELYKKHRQEIYDGYVFPIGEKPDNQSWPGFQCHNFENQSGYITIFRELNNNESSKQIKLKFLAEKNIKLVDLRQGSENRVSVPADGNITFEIAFSPDFKFFKYQCI